jgi:hypothetical protein
VNERDYHAAVGEATNFFVEGLTPFALRVMSLALPPTVESTELHHHRDAAGGQRTGVHRTGDLSIMLWVSTERLGATGVCHV